MLYVTGASSGLVVAWWQRSREPDPVSIASWWNGVWAQTVSLLADPWWSLALAGAFVATAVVFAIRVAQMSPFEADI